MNETKSLIEEYLQQSQEFERHTNQVQSALEVLGWKWVAKDVSGYSENQRYQYWLVSPKMYQSLDLDTLDTSGREFETPVLESEPSPEWIENADYILF